VQILRVTPAGEIGFVAQEFFQTGPLLSLFFCRPKVSAQASSVVRSSLLRRQGSIGINFFSKKKLTFFLFHGNKVYLFLLINFSPNKFNVCSLNSLKL